MIIMTKFNIIDLGKELNEFLVSKLKKLGSKK